MSIKARALTALRWNLAGKLAARVVTWAIMLYVVRVLDPAVFGLMALAVVTIEAASLVSRAGLDSALIQKKTLDQADTARFFGGVLLTGSAVFLVVYLGADLVASLFGNTSLAAIIRVLAAKILIDAIALVPLALLRRRLEYRLLSIIDLIAALISALAVLGMVVQGYGIWSLVAGWLLNVGVNAMGVLLATRFRTLPRLGLTMLLPEFRFGVRVMAQSLVSFLGRRLDTLLIGRLLGTEALGLYTIGRNVARIPSRLVMQSVRHVGFSAFSRLQNEKETARHYFLRSVETASFIFFPVMWGLACVAEHLILVVLGAKWAGAIPVIQLLSPALPFVIVMRLFRPILNAMGRPDVEFRNALTTAVCLPIAVALGTNWGLSGAVVGWIAAQVVASLVNLRRTLPVLEISITQIRRALAPVIGIAAAMSVVVLAFDLYLPDSVAATVRLLLLVFGGGLAYLSLAFVVTRDRLVRTAGLLRG